MRAVCYSRVSTSHHDQNPQVQAEALRRYCISREWDVTFEIIDHGYSGASDRRPGLQELMTLVKSRSVDAIVVVKMDRLFRSLKHLVSAIDEFQTLGVLFISIGDQIDMSTASGRLMTQIIGAFSEFERDLIRERTLAGLNHAKNSGVLLGRPRLHDYQEILRLREKGLSYRAIVRLLKVPMGTINEAIRSARKTPSKFKEITPIKSKVADE